MIVVLGIFEVEAADRQRYLDEKAHQVAATLAETGCLDYAFAADAGDPGRVRLVEKWESMEALGAHVAALRAAPPPERPGVASRPVTLEVLEAQPVRPPWA